MRKDAVTPELHDHIVRRDGMCFMFFVNRGHVCRDRWGEPHSPFALGRLTVDHVHDVAGGIRGKRAPSDKRHLTAMCWQANVDGPSRMVRQQQRDYLTKLYEGETV